MRAQTANWPNLDGRCSAVSAKTKLGDWESVLDDESFAVTGSGCLDFTASDGRFIVCSYLADNTGRIAGVPGS